ncbi:MAG: hypothetical protein HY255_04520 [Betaproteobacteria bacterium]|nr:hypothetical protein [Betaproteobacteria bacterium]
MNAQSALAFSSLSATDAPVTLEQCLEVLEARRQALCEELRSFARPIAACDADCNAVLAERAAIVLAISQLQALSRGETRIPHPRDDH